MSNYNYNIGLRTGANGDSLVMESFRPNAVDFTKCVVDVPAPIVNETPVALQFDLDQSVLTLDRRLAHDELTSEDRADLFHHFRALLKVAITNAKHRNEREHEEGTTANGREDEEEHVRQGPRETGEKEPE